MGGKMEFKMKPIGVIHSPFKKKEEAPIQPFRSGEEGSVEVFQEYEEGLKDIEGFSRIILVYAFHKSRGFELLVKPFLDSERRGLFATRAPWRPNPIGISEVRLLGREGNALRVGGIDVLDGTPLLDIKPSVPCFAAKGKGARLGWLEAKLKGGGAD